MRTSVDTEALEDDVLITNQKIDSMDHLTGGHLSGALPLALLTYPGSSFHRIVMHAEN